MTITKYLHSCLLIEEGNQSILLDPGQFTYDAEVFPRNAPEALHAILITHDHTDHFSLPFVRELHERYPDTPIISTPSVVSELTKHAIPAGTTALANITIRHASHNEILLAQAPENIAFTVYDKLTHPGDSYDFSATTQVLAMPMTAPWGSMVGAMEKIRQVKPQVVIPIHDWHWKEEALQGFYPRIQTYLKEHGIRFLIPETGIPLTLP